MICGSIMYLFVYIKTRGVSRIGGPISLGSLKKAHQILKGGGGSNGLMGGSSTFVSWGGGGPVHLSH